MTGRAGKAARKLVFGWSAALVCAVFAGCRVSGPEVVAEWPHEAALAPARHVHSVQCGHFLEDGRWNFLPGHLHGPDCGHRFVEGCWCADVAHTLPLPAE